MPFIANGQNIIIEGVGGGTANANGSFRNLYYSGSISLNGAATLTNFGYVTGGYTVPVTNVIQRFPFALAITNAADVGDLSKAKSDMGGQSSPSHGYVCNGYDPTDYYGSLKTIDRFPFSSAIVNATNLGDLTGKKAYGVTGVSSPSHGYTAWGYDPQVPEYYDRLERFLFANEIVTALVGNTLEATYAFGNIGTNSQTHGYFAGGGTTPLYGVIEKFAFALEVTNTYNSGNLSVIRFYGAGLKSSTHGYLAGGSNASPTPYSNIIDRFPFALSITNTTDVGDLTLSRTSVMGESSSTHGYTSGGYGPGPTIYNVIDRFPFALSITNATDVGDLLSVTYAGTGHEF